MNELKLFDKSLNNLIESYDLYYPPKDDFFSISLIAQFKVCFEVALDSLKEALLKEEKESVLFNSKHYIIQLSYEKGLINDPNTWFDMEHIFNENRSTFLNKFYSFQIVNQIKSEFIPTFEDLRKTLRFYFTSK